MSDRPTVPILRLAGVSLRTTIGADYLLQNVSLEIQPGEKIGIVGASGAGKTSLLRLLNGLVSPSEGTIYVDGTLAKNFSPIRLRRKIVLVNQESKLLGMRVDEALSYPLKLQQLPEIEIRSRLNTWTNLLRIPAEWFTKTELQLSVGQRQLVAIARALILQPEAILLDEPTSALDVGLSSHLLAVLDELNQTQNLTIIMVNHQLELIKNFCDRLILLERGTVAEDVPATESNWYGVSQKMLQIQQREADW